jgi:hypothetical protein
LLFQGIEFGSYPLDAILGKMMQDNTPIIDWIGVLSCWGCSNYIPAI